MTRQGRQTKVVADKEQPNSILSLMTDLVFVTITAYLLTSYAFILLSPASLLVAIREVFISVYLLMALGFLAVRRSARIFTAKKVDYLYTIVGYAAPLLFQPTRYGKFPLIGALLETGGAAFVASAFLSLNRSFGLAPQNRGIKTAGAYRLIRHPMYLGYILAEVGYVVDNFSDFNLFVLTISVLFLLLRLRAEEQLLRQDPAYRNYSRKTRWKLLPFLF